jgi:serine O-acetyltransferase
MIKCKKDLFDYLCQDFYVNEMPKLTNYEKFLKIFDPNLIWRFIVSLRKYEYYMNTNRRMLIDRVLRKYFLYRYKKLGYKLGFSIPPNVFGPGLRIPHYGTIVVHPSARIGSNCVIQAGVNIGINQNGVPQIGNNVYIGPGAKLFGDIIIANNIAIGANSVVNKTFDKENITIAGIPAKVIKNFKANER